MHALALKCKFKHVEDFLTYHTDITVCAKIKPIMLYQVYVMIVAQYVQKCLFYRRCQNAMRPTVLGFPFMETYGINLVLHLKRLIKYLYLFMICHF